MEVRKLTICPICRYKICNPENSVEIDWDDEQKLAHVGCVRQQSNIRAVFEQNGN